MNEILKIVGVVSAGWILAITTLWALFQFIGKSYVSSYFRSRETQAQHDHEMRTKADEQRHSEHLEAIRHQFTLMQRREDVRFQQLHPERTKKLIEVFGQLHELLYALRSYVSAMHGNDAHRMERWTNYDGLYYEVRRNYILHRYYFSDSNVKYIDAVLDHMKDVDDSVAHLVVHTILKTTEEEAMEQRRQRSNDIKGARAQLKIVEQAIGDLEAEIRRTLGGEE